MAQEIFVVYDKDTGFINGGAGVIDREWDDQHEGDDSTTSQSIKRILKKNPKRRVVFLPLQDIPDPDTVKIVDGQLVPLVDGEETDDIIREKNKKKIAQQMRKDAIEKLKAKGELSADFKE